MKKYITIALALVMAIPVFNSCQKDADFLTEEPKTIYTKENAFEKATQADATLMRVYEKIHEMYTYQIWIFDPDHLNNLMFGEGADVMGSTRPEEAASGFNNYWALRSNDSKFNALWTNMYQVAGYANLVLEALDTIEGISKSDSDYVEGQARFFRGWAYLRLAEMFGGVPIVDHFEESLKYDYTRDTREATYTFAIEDLKLAADLLPDYPKQNGRVAKGVANHFLAEAYLGRGVETGNKADYGLAISAADATIAKHPLMTQRFGARSLGGAMPAGISDNGVESYLPDANPYFDLFVIGNYSYANGNTESLFVKEQPLYSNYAENGGSMDNNGNVCGQVYRSGVTWSSEYQAMHQSSSPWGGRVDYSLYPGGTFGSRFNPGTWGMIMTTNYTDYYVWEDEFADDDRNSQIVRWDPTILDMDSPLYGDGHTKVTREMLAQPAQLSRISCKIVMWDDWGWDLAHYSMMGFPYEKQWGRDIYIARSAETYLLRAEAKLRNGDADGAASDLNALRARAHASKMFTGSEVDLYTILDERARELAWEEMRWPTLLRMGGQGKNEVMHTQLENFSQGSYDTDYFTGKSFPEWTLFPIPLSVIQLNTDAELTQNPGWD